MMKGFLKVKVFSGKARCTRCDTTFTPRVGNVIPPYPDKTEYRVFVNCPRCLRGYGRREDGTWYCDRPLVIVDTIVVDYYTDHKGKIHKLV